MFVGAANGSFSGVEKLCLLTNLQPVANRESDVG